MGIESKDFASLVFLSKGKKSEKMRGEFPVIGEWKMRIEGSIDKDIYKYPDVVNYLNRRRMNKEFVDFFEVGYTDILYRICSCSCIGTEQRVRRPHSEICIPI